MGGSTSNHLDVAEEDALRAQFYGLLASLLAAPPTPEVLAMVGAIEGDETGLGQALTALATAARGTTAKDVEDEYQTVFIGVGGGELTPYASYYLAGFMFEKPLARLRIEMGRLGIARADHVHEPEDHIASLCEMMCGLITGTYGEPADLARQQTFFDVHVASWAELFFKDLEAASGASFYKPVGTVGRLFMEVEAQAFKIAA
jgi:TorA maturation chaperone TorD